MGLKHKVCPQGGARGEVMRSRGNCRSSDCDIWWWSCKKGHFRWFQSGSKQTLDGLFVVWTWTPDQSIHLLIDQKQRCVDACGEREINSTFDEQIKRCCEKVLWKCDFFFSCERFHDWTSDDVKWCSVSRPHTQQQKQIHSLRADGGVPASPHQRVPSDGFIN